MNKKPVILNAGLTLLGKFPAVLACCLVLVACGGEEKSDISNSLNPLPEIGKVNNSIPERFVITGLIQLPSTEDVIESSIYGRSDPFSTPVDQYALVAPDGLTKTIKNKLQRNSSELIGELDEFNYQGFMASRYGATALVSYKGVTQEITTHQRQEAGSSQSRALPPAWKVVLIDPKTGRLLLSSGVTSVEIYPGSAPQLVHTRNSQSALAQAGVFR